MSNFKVGQKVVCVDSSVNRKPQITYSGRYIIKDEIYTIKGFNPVTEGVYLEEHVMGFYNNMVNPKHQGMEASYRVERFRHLHHEFAEEVISMLLEQPETIEL